MAPPVALRTYRVQGVKVPGFFDLGIPELVEPLNFTFIKAVLMEAMCMLLFLFFVIGNIVNQCTGNSVFDAAKNTQVCPLDYSRIFNISMSFGLAIFVLVYAAAAYSGGHLNPAVTVGLLVANKISVMRAFIYIVAQMAGGTAGVGLVKAINKEYYYIAGGGCNALSPGITNAAGWTMEALLTFALVFMVLAATDGVRGKTTAHLPVLAPFSIGMVVLLAHMVAIPIDGCSINPARTFATAVVFGNWSNHWLFWVGPLSGGIVAALVYELVYRPNYNEQDVKEEPSKEPIVTMVKTKSDGLAVLNNNAGLGPDHLKDNMV